MPVNLAHTSKKTKTAQMSLFPQHKQKQVKIIIYADCHWRVFAPICYVKYRICKCIMMCELRDKLLNKLTNDRN